MVNKDVTLRLAMLISGGASTACAIIDAIQKKRLHIIPVVVIGSKKDIPGFVNLQKKTVKKEDCVVVDPSFYKSSDEFANALISVCKKRNVNLVGQYGWLPLTPKKFIHTYVGRIINQHPGPLDVPRMDFGGKGMYGRRVHAALLYFRRMTKHDMWTEATCHMVTEEFDKGDVIKRKQVPIFSADTVEELQKRVLPIEHQVQIDALSDFVHNRVRTQKRSIPLIKKNEEHILAEAKHIASVLYPHG